MESIKIMVEEHSNIRRMLKVIRKLCYNLMTNSNYDIADFHIVIDFVRNYADKHHHGKEENILFETMNKKIERLAKSGAITGMYIEHDMGRLYMSNLEKAVESFKNKDDEARLDIIANAISYGDLLNRHIEKENTALYKFAENMLSDNSKSFVEDECKKVEELAIEVGIQEKYIALLEKLENKYLD
ncbi:hemerythrin domain-containing protein [Tissierella praeacuta]|uniref:hemerythrin domain-containing protein n=1 Tax=Tissierella praeacuta TaxID=43131 RepID=UPI0028AC3D51|nr:hemerythrin domain-containing protein [Tissierella praeacuta]